MIKKNKKFLFTLLLSVLLLTVFAGCNMGGLPWDNALWGTWADSYTTKTFTNTTWEFDGAPAGEGGWDYSGEIVKFVNGSYNIVSENPADGQYGYMVLKTTVHESSTSSVGTFTVLRWRALATEDGVTTVEHSEGFPTFDTAEEAEAEAVEATNFTYYSNLTKTAE
ncbi:MAG: hypothetical protein JEZ04_14020 [Spirochaetales bacterium]|nr:hypothetical protein [Spirochaetales bacterium]